MKSVHVVRKRLYVAHCHCSCSSHLAWNEREVHWAVEVIIYTRMIWWPAHHLIGRSTATHTVVQTAAAGQECCTGPVPWCRRVNSARRARGKQTWHPERPSLPVHWQTLTSEKTWILWLRAAEGLQADLDCLRLPTPPKVGPLLPSAQSVGEPNRHGGGWKDVGLSNGYKALLPSAIVTGSGDSHRDPCESWLFLSLWDLSVFVYGKKFRSSGIVVIVGGRVLFSLSHGV